MPLITTGRILIWILIYPIRNWLYNNASNDRLPTFHDLMYTVYMDNGIKYHELWPTDRTIVDKHKETRHYGIFLTVLILYIIV